MNRLLSAIKTSTHKVRLPTTASNCYLRTSAPAISIAELRQNLPNSTRTTNHKMSGGTATIAIGQMRSTKDKLANRVQVQEIVELAVKQNASVCISLRLSSRCSNTTEHSFISFHLSVNSLSSYQNAVIMLGRIVMKCWHWPNLYMARPSPITRNWQK